MLPKCTGFEVLETIETVHPYYCFISIGDLPARLKSFEYGAIDFVAKPFFIEELIVRIRTRLKLRAAETRRVILLADTVIDLDARIVLRNNIDLGLTSYEFNVLTFLCQRPGRAQTRSQIAQCALSEDGDCFDRTVDSHISRIRKKLGPNAGGLIKTIWGIGYRCDLEEV